MTHTHTEAETQAEGEAGSMQGAPPGTRSRVSRTRPWAEGGAKPLSRPGCPHHHLLKFSRQGRLGGCLGGSVLERLPPAQVVILESWDPVPHPACFSLSLSLMNKQIKYFFKILMANKFRPRAFPTHYPILLAPSYLVSPSMWLTSP